MKTIRIIGLFVIMAILSGCDPPWLMPVPFSLRLSFQDASGKDLVEGIEYIKDNGYDGGLSGLVKPELYTLKAFVDTKNISTPATHIQEHKNLYYFYRETYAFSEVPYSCLSFETGESGSKKTFIWLLACPHIFGDDTEHEIVAYCKKKDRAYFCTRLTFDGMEITEILNSDQVSMAAAKVILE